MALPAAVKLQKVFKSKKAVGKVSHFRGGVVLFGSQSREKQQHSAENWTLYSSSNLGRGKGHEIKPENHAFRYGGGTRKQDGHAK
jgi:hypothetical protein